MFIHIQHVEANNPCRTTKQSQAHSIKHTESFLKASKTPLDSFSANVFSNSFLDFHDLYTSVCFSISKINDYSLCLKCKYVKLIFIWTAKFYYMYHLFVNLHKSRKMTYSYQLMEVDHSRILFYNILPIISDRYWDTEDALMGHFCSSGALLGRKLLTLRIQYTM